MKARVQYFLGFCLIGLIFLILGFLIFQTVDRTNLFVFQKWSEQDTTSVLLIVVLLVIIAHAIKQRNFVFIQKRIEETSSFLKDASIEEVLKSLPNKGRDQFSKLLQSFGLLLEKQEQTLEEHRQKYNQLLYSYMNLEEKYAQSYTVQLILEEISRELETDCLLKKTTDIIMGVFGSKSCAIYMVDEEKDVLIARASSGITNNEFESIEPISVSSSSIIARAWRNRRVYTEADMKPREIEELNKRDTHSILAIPLTGRRGCQGIMAVEHELGKGLSPDLVEFAKLIAQELSLSVENAVLKTTTAVIQKMLPAGILARYGGEEFVIVLPEIDQDKAVELAEKIRRRIAEHEFTTAEGNQIGVTLSAGLANYPLVSDGYESLLQKSDEALYEAKKAGRNRVCVASVILPDFNRSSVK
jgi:diguanylate cyclase (GGDEF)-like protein